MRVNMVEEHQYCRKEYNKVVKCHRPMEKTKVLEF